MNELKKAYGELAAIDQPNIKLRICTECGVTLDTFYKWMDYPHRIKPPFRTIIASL